MSRVHLDEPRPGDAIGDVPRDVDRHDRVLGSVQDKRRHPDRRQHVADVDLFVHERKSLDGSRASTPAEIVDPLVRLLIVNELHTRAHGIQCLVVWAEEAQIALRLSTVLLLGPAPRVVRRPHRAGIGAPEHERSGPLRVRCGEEKTHRRTLRGAEERSPAGTGRVHHRPRVIHPRLERGRAADPVGHATSALVEPDQPAERGKRSEGTRERGRPDELDVGDERRDKDDVKGTVARDLVGDRDVAAPCVERFWLHRHSVARHFVPCQ